ncbi:MULTISPECIES: TrmH family RNA methyltransferase [Exiguobacterium]|uniref:RNA methyltransferase n=1 Tax=Exiguobacterium alkaliphilum TaxID=1428684 RepID=A0ABT2KT13_9BACL|nr:MULTISPECIES: RNA methyltransferase [Exiguobacterium]MCT4794097.1 RNA methyltransferase [Exiguobacterium alkaliphilum]QUE87665.1 RNA methyltransferase [Exiguobacterium alkaliphilum]
MTKITSTKSETIKRLKRLMTKKGRQESGQFLVEGEHLVDEAIRAGRLVQLIVGESYTPKRSWRLDQMPVLELSDHVADILSETEKTQGVFAVVNMSPVERKMKHVLVLDRIQDPGNLGTMIRTADAAGFDTVLLGKGTVDPYNAKAVRATQGSLFHVNVRTVDLLETLPELKSDGFHVYGTALEKAKSYDQIDFGDRVALVIGNEAQGVHADVLALCDTRVHIPMLGDAESLNAAVAAGILMYRIALR